MYSDFEFWDKIDGWPKDQPPSYEFCGKIDNHEIIYEEMEKFDGWTHSFAEDFTEELIENIACLSGSTRDRWEAIQEKWKIYAGVRLAKLVRLAEFHCVKFSVSVR